MADQYKHTAVNGSDIQVILRFPDLLVNGEPGVLHLASVITVSYSVYREKAPVYNIGQPLLSGFGIGKKYVAGSLITVSFDTDEISDFINRYLESQENKDFDRTDALLDGGTYKKIHTMMRDDLSSFDMVFIMEDEMSGVGNAKEIILYDAQFINNGQVMSINDLITENTLSFIARDIREQRPFGTELESYTKNRIALTASQILNFTNG